MRTKFSKGNFGNASINSESIENRTIEQVDFVNDGAANFIPATFESNGDVGLVPKPLIKDRNHVIYGNGLWDGIKVIAWETSKQYSVGCIINEGNNLFICKTDHTSSSSFESDYSNWNIIYGSNHGSSHITGGLDVIPDVVPGSNSGLMNGVDKTKLDGVAANATKTESSSTAGKIKINDTDVTVIELGTTATTACAGNDTRLSNNRTPIDGSVTIPKTSFLSALTGQDGKFLQVNETSGIIDYVPITSGGYNRIVLPLNTNLTPYITKNNTAGSVVYRRFIFPGTDKWGIPTSMNVIGWLSNTSTSSHTVEIYNETGRTILMQVVISSTTVGNLVTSTTIINAFPTSKAVLAMRGTTPSTSRQTMYISEIVLENQ